jgi:hypothetical protein
MIRRALIPILLAAFVGAGPAAAGDSAPGRFSLTLSAGLFRPAGDEMLSLYGSGGVPLSFRADWRFAGAFSVFAGFRSLRLAGSTLVVGPPLENERYDLRLALDSWRAGLQAAWETGRWSVRGYAGLESLAWEEEWPDAKITSRGRSTGVLAGAAVDFRIVRGLGLTAHLEYDRVTTSGKGPLAAEPQAGGWEAGAGLVVRF